jgi:hypothetical protein
MIFKIGSNKEPTEKEDIRSMLLHLEDEYRKANISEKDYWELKQKYSDKLRKLDKNFDKKASEKKAVKEIPKLDKKKEREDIEMFLESLEEQFRKGEINKEEYENIRNINLERLNDIDYVKIGLDDVEEDEKPEEIKLELKEKKKGIFGKIFRKLKKQKKEEGKIEIDVPEEKKESEPEIPDIESEEVELKYGKGEEIEMEIKEEDQIPKVEEEIKTEEVIPEEKVEEMPEETVVEKEPKAVEEKPKKKGFLKSMFGKKERKEDIEKVEGKTKEEKPKTEEKKPEEPKKEEKRLEVGEIEEVTPEVIEKLASQMAEDEGAEQIAEPEEPAEEETSKALTTSGLGVEIEKLKVKIDAMKESKEAADENIQNLSENIGEIRSLVMQTDANFKTSLSKIEKMDDEISDVRPREISKKFNEIKENFEKNELEMEKFKQKLSDTEEKLNQIHEMVKNIGGVENLSNLNKNVQEKLKDITEAIKYIQRVGTKTEKIFIDLSKGLDDLVLIKAKQEDFDESLKNVLTSIDSLNIKLKDYVQKDDLNVFREDNLLIKKEIEKINKVLPVAEIKLPEEVIKLRKEREDIEMFLESLESQFANDKISKAEYEDVRRSNLKKLEDIEDKLEKEWKDIDKMIKAEKPEETPKEGEEKKKSKVRTKKKAKKKRKSQSSRKKKILSELKKMK